MGTDKEARYSIEDCNIRLTIFKGAWKCGDGVPTIQEYDLDENKVLLRRKESLIKTLSADIC